LGFIGRIPQSIGATSPHFTWVLQVKSQYPYKFEHQLSTNLKPQSSHSSTGFQPSRFIQISHLATSNALEKNRSSGFQPASTVLSGEPLRLPFLISCPFAAALGRLPPGLMRVKRWTKGIERMVEPPPVAAVVETIEE